MQKDEQFKSAVIVMPPEDLWEQIQDIRRTNDKAYNRWMPHINLIFPFVSDTHFDQAEKVLSTSLQGFKPFTIRFEGFDYFEHGASSCTLFLNPIINEGQNQLPLLQNTIEKAFPYCNEQSSKSSDGFHGHLTVGQFRGKRSVEMGKKKYEANWKPIEFTVDRVYFISRVGYEPFKVRKTVLFSAASVPKPIQTTQPVQQIRQAEQEVKSELSSTTSASSSTPAPIVLMMPSKVTGVKADVLERLQTWITSRNGREHLPKTKEKLRTAIKPMCSVKVAPTIGPESILKTFEEEKLITFEKTKKGEEIVKYLKKQDNDGGSSASSYYNSVHSNPYQNHKEDGAEVALKRCREWILQPSNTPKTRQTLSNSIKQLCLQKEAMEPDEAIKLLVDHDVITIDISGSTNAVIYNI